jgi:hypothetical protein
VIGEKATEIGESQHFESIVRCARTITRRPVLLNRIGFPFGTFRPSLRSSDEPRPSTSPGRRREGSSGHG